MTAPVPEGVVLLPCPFCGEELVRPFLKNPEVYQHPDGTSCFAGRAIIHPENYAAWNQRAALSVPREPSAPQLAVWYGEMPESNGRRNWTASLHQEGRDPHMEGFCFARSEYPDQVRYMADRMRWVVGIGPEPDILAYDEKAHSGYVEPDHGPSVGEMARGLLEKWRDGEFESGADAAADDKCRCGACRDRFEASPIIEAWLTALAKKTDPRTGDPR